FAGSRPWVAFSNMTCVWAGGRPKARGGVGLLELDDVEGQAPLFVARDLVAQAFVNAVVVVEGQDDRLDLFDFGLGDVDGIADDDFVSALAGAGRGAVQDAAARAAFAVNDVGADTRARRLVPDVDEFHRQDACGLAVVGVQRDGTMVIEVGTGDAYAMELAPYDFSHVDLRGNECKR